MAVYCLAELRIPHSGGLSALCFQVDYVVSTFVLPVSSSGFVCLPNCISVRPSVCATVYKSLYCLVVITERT